MVVCVCYSMWFYVFYKMTEFNLKGSASHPSVALLSCQTVSHVAYQHKLCETISTMLGCEEPSLLHLIYRRLDSAQGVTCFLFPSLRPPCLPRAAAHHIIPYTEMKYSSTPAQCDYKCRCAIHNHHVCVCVSNREDVDTGQSASVCLCHLSFVHGHVGVEFLWFIVWGAMSGEPHAEVMLCRLAAVGHAEDIYISQVCLKELR